MKKLTKKVEITGRIILKTGTHIGGTNSSMSIGGIDKSVIRNPLNNQPYIPGSSLKGKMRSLLEISEGSFEQVNMGQVKYGPSKSGIAAFLFGTAGGDNQLPSRVLVRDASLINADELLQKTDIPFTEGKTEVVIDRITSAAMPRQIERVPAGAIFSLNLVLNIWEEDTNEQKIIEETLKCLQLVKDDYIGGNGSRGYGQVGFVIEDIIEKSTNDFYGKEGMKPVSVKNNYEGLLESLK